MDAKDRSPKGAEQHTQDQQTPKSPARKRRLAIGLGALALTLVLVWPVISTLQPAYYERYKPLRSRMHSWRNSTHAPVPCISCHVEPGLVSFVVFAARSVPAFYSQLLVGPNETNLLRAPSRRACQQCHTTYRTVSPAGDLLIPHRAHVTVINIDCAECHKNLVHSPNTQGFNAPKMTFCLTACHNGRKAKDKCTACHTQKYVPENHKRPNWLATHSQRTAEVNCGACHGWSPKLCESCHRKRPRTHVGNWRKLHQVRARERGKGCLFCHGGRKFCLKCHD